MLKKVDNQTILISIDFHCMYKKYNESQWELKQSSF